MNGIKSIGPGKEKDDRSAVPIASVTSYVPDPPFICCSPLITPQQLGATDAKVRQNQSNSCSRFEANIIMGFSAHNVKVI